MENGKSIAMIIGGAVVGLGLVYGASKISRADDDGNVIRGNNQIMYVSGNQGLVVTGQKFKGATQIVNSGSGAYVVTQSNSDGRMVQTVTSQRKPQPKTEQKNNYLKELNQYKQNEANYQNQLDRLQHKVDSLEIACANKEDVASELELYAAEFHSMNKRYGNLPYNIEKKISTYHSKE